MNRRKFLRHAKRIEAEGQGVFNVQMVHQHDVPGLYLASLLNDAEAMQTANLIAQSLKLIATAQPPALCLLCDNELSAAKPPRIFVITTAHRDDPSGAMVNGLCAGCAGKPDLLAAVLDRYRDLLMPDLRRLPPFGKPGEA